MPRRLLGIALALAAILGAWADAGPVATITPADAPRHEGQTVTIAGAVQAVEVRTGTTRFQLADDGHAVSVTLQGPLPHGLGTWLEATGRLARLGSGLVLLADQVEAVSGPGPERPAWQQLADDPGAWSGRWIRLDGTYRSGTLSGGGIELGTGDGPWDATGMVTATGILAYDPACICHRFHADTVAPWNSS